MWEELWSIHGLLAVFRWFLMPGTHLPSLQHAASEAVHAASNWVSSSAISDLTNSASVVAEEDFDALRYVDPLIGSDNGGNVFAGATLPYGMAKASPDTNSASNQGGFTLDGSPVTGFSTMHDSGTGSQPSLGNFPLFAYTTCPSGEVNECAFPKKSRAEYGHFDKKDVIAEPGLFNITLKTGIRVEMTTTERASLIRFNFPQAGKPLILQDLTDLGDTRQDNASIRVNRRTGQIRGNARFQPSFGSGSYVLYFCTDFRGADMLDSGIFVDSRASTEVNNLTISRSINGYPLPGGAFVRFKSADKPIIARVATSFISERRACSHAQNEIPDFNFDRVSVEAKAIWRRKLSPIKINTARVDESFARNFYSGIYRTMINPQNYTGENPLWRSREPYWDSFYCLWDSFRSQIPFLIIIDPTSVAQMVRSLIDTYSHLGWLPDCRMSLCKGFTQGGSNADNVLADAYLKNITEGIDWNLGYEAVLKDAEQEPFDWSVNGRGGVDSWKRLGYIPIQDFDFKGFGTLTRSVSRTLEYSYNDFCIAQMANKMGRGSDREKYLKSSGNWQNLYKKDQKSAFFNGTDTGFRGFFEPKYLNQTWAYQDPLSCSNLDGQAVCSLQNNGPETFESSLWEYGFFVPHDQGTLIDTYGGPDAFVRRLDFLHDQNITYIGNEPAFLTVFQYHYAGRPALSAKRAHSYIPSFFSADPAGLPGNDDSGAMGSFLAFSMMGLFPNPGQDVYLIIPPFFESIEITHPQTGLTARVRNVNFDPTYRNIYIQSATLNGEPYRKSWVDHKFFTEGQELVLTLGRRESKWGTRVRDLPPSLGAYRGFNRTFPSNRTRIVDATYKGEFGELGKDWGV
ncbi:glycosyl hydrolase family 92 [Colletotrichum graminicola]|uniref:Glycosyl hydrolase family 92 n=1 Tax=Colletotrichum graminicola (strain M1.001 / M2 / FGSC 10212) TaxID=645133 RepID=E3QZM0_COLGM|nr:glycosyl hydrolase family 92 [Colletotrichum graminicola M1.001]EFQ36308.1 glycosyl hydrolase family 92 [Colletotrichum graminicola M1.001]WDK10275.1 glycosyl hydrolase family 92 [Colletotrichum graminicola]